jgi:hypothetical protein
MASIDCLIPTYVRPRVKEGRWRENNKPLCEISIVILFLRFDELDFVVESLLLEYILCRAGKSLNLLVELIVWKPTESENGLDRCEAAEAFNLEATKEEPTATWGKASERYRAHHQPTPWRIPGPSADSRRQ